jgi:ribosomal protein L19E
MTMSKNKITFTVDLDGESVDLCVVKPSAAVLQESQKVWNKTLTESLQSGAILRKKLDLLLEDQNIWNDEKEAEYSEMLKNISDKEAKLRKGGVTKAQGRKMALELRKLRNEAREFRSQRNYLSGATAESIADNSRFNYMVYACTLHNSGDNAGQHYFDSLDEYLESESEAALQAASKLAELMYGLDENSELKLPENQFLIKYGFANAEGHLIDSQGRLVTEEGQLVDSEGYFVDAVGNRVDKFGNTTDEFDINKVIFDE